MYRQPRPATLPPLHIRDTPRYEWRGAMLDVARHFFDVDEVKQFIDLLALHKMNRLHLHLADDQGWRIEISKWPDLTARGGQTEVGGTPGGFYTQAQYADLVAYAADRFVTIVPEIDMPGHTNAALSSIDELNCNGQAPPRFTGTAVGFSALCVGSGLHLHVSRRRDRRDRGDDAGAVLPRRRRRGADADARSVPRLRRARAGASSRSTASV